MGVTDIRPETETEETLSLVDVGASSIHVVFTHVEEGYSHTVVDATSARLPPECLSLFGADAEGQLDPADDLTREERAWITAESEHLADVVDVDVDGSVETIDPVNDDSAWEVDL